MHLLVVIIKKGISGVTHKRVSFYGTLNLWLSPQVIPHSQKIRGEDFQREYVLYSARKISKKQMAENLNLSRPTLDKLLKEKGLM